MKGPHTMQRYVLAAGLCALGLSCALAAAAPMPVIYPAKNQSAAQTDRDKLSCYDWSRGQSGFDPMQPPPAAPAQATAAAAVPTTSTQPDGSMVRGAAGGAAIAELTKGDVGKGAAIGVVGAGVRDQIKKQQAQQQKAAQQQAQAQQQQAAMAQQQAALAQGKAQFDRGFAACMEARGYVVK
jgi:hypothetical protein